jgi:uncharacterized membrane protein YtjA (UPF0391 family)
VWELKWHDFLRDDSFWRKEIYMLRWSAVFLVIAIIAAALGYGGIAADAAEIAKVLFFIFLGVFVVTLILGLIAGQKLFGQRR